MPFSGRTPATEQFLNQPLPQKIINLNQFNTTQPIPHISEINTPVDYQGTLTGFESIGDGSTFFLAQMLSPKDQLNSAYPNQIRWPIQAGQPTQNEMLVMANNNAGY